MAQGIQVNTQGVRALQRALAKASEKSLDDAWLTLRGWGEEYKRRVQRVTPVQFGRLRQSWQVQATRAGRTMSVGVGTSIRGEGGEPYPALLELGTARIAGGRVMAWQPGQPPITSWPAKDANTLGGNPEQMPFLRPVGFEIAPQVVKDMRTAISKGLESVFSGRRF